MHELADTKFLDQGLLFYLFGLFTVLIYFLFLAAPRHMELPGQESDLSHGHNLSHGCGNTGSFTHGAGWGSNPWSQHSQDATGPHHARAGAPAASVLSLTVPFPLSFIPGGGEVMTPLCV